MVKSLQNDKIPVFFRVFWGLLCVFPLFINSKFLKNQNEF
ncbi:hypothetical protein ADICYQ_3313 [Cyclobacterium qasimii M12-11B]|uniref:Uncharacterized protein n=1 Tax=Cyclobacterium qasimii M12-11B TaxID=641524 RepID=S7WUA0_9BACT|nr:hypothetical protein ADICYQ_3313 [Cyclobacterium qasimii M12-11B]